MHKMTFPLKKNEENNSTQGFEPMTFALKIEHPTSALQHSICYI